MHWWENEYVYPVSPKSTRDISAVAELVLGELQPSALSRPEPVDVLKLVDHTLPSYGVHVVPVSHAELPDSEAETRITPAGVEVLIRKDQWDELLAGGPLAHRARSTVAHETGHVVLHVPEIRRRASALARKSPVRRVDLPAYLDPEWQAWTFALAFLMPPPVVRTLGDRSPKALAELFHVSEDLATSFHKRFKGVI